MSDSELESIVGDLAVSHPEIATRPYFPYGGYCVLCRCELPITTDDDGELVATVPEDHQRFCTYRRAVAWVERDAEKGER